MARRQVGQLETPGGEKGVGADEEGIGPLARKRCEGRIDLAAGAGVEDLDLQPDGAAAASTSRNVALGTQGLAGLTSTATRTAAGTSSCRSSSRFAVSSPLKKLMPVSVAARSSEAGDKTKLDRVFGGDEDDGNRRGCRLGRERRRGARWR